MSIDGPSEAVQDFRAVGTCESVPPAPDDYLAAVSARQRAYLRLLVRTSFPDRRPVQHDFACGTGRTVRLLHGMVRDAHGYDNSPQSLAVARRSGLRARWHEVDADGPGPQPASGEGPVVVTVFGMLLDASDEARERAVAFASRALPSHTSGLLIVENHGSANSVRALRPRARRSRRPGLTHLAVATLLHRYGFTILERRGFSLFPRLAYRWPALRPLVRRLDGLLCRCEFLSRYATDVLYVARRRPIAPRPHRAVRG